ncbi:gliding motility-associated-like protein [Christiangramia gaetbulicola]|uniref:Gliding motility-associated-like protein n=1 Tax=Christiangramia gaetbulicola TaxID=703340 RepID=A0A2T6AEX1_9FLAO|nr:T9SS type B sorting domain-containing protein [Christiangramia gaetbulicola]PTX42352.1 gliding motility-associated-like protein [Christiangramia gaetbulicola]
MKTIFALILIFHFHISAINHAEAAESSLPKSEYLFSTGLLHPSEFPAPIFKRNDTNPTLDIQGISLQECDYERGFGLSSVDGITSFNLLLAYPPNTSNISFYENRADLENDVEIINPGNYRNTNPFNQIVFGKRINGNNGEVISEVTLTVIPIPETAVPIGDFYVCNSNTDGGSPTAVYDFEEIGRSLFGDEDVTFHANIYEAFENDRNFAFGEVLAQEFIVYIRKQNTCEPIYSLSLNILDKPEVTLQEEYQICADQGSLNLSLPSENFTYEWFKENDSNLLSGSSTAEISEGGSYTVIATRTYNINNALYECSTERSFRVVAIDNPEIEAVEIEQGYSNQILIQMREPGDYEFSTSYLNQVYQESNLFENAPPGRHEIYVRERNGCGFEISEVSILGFPKFFTPNNDGINDIWRIKGFQGSNNPVRIYNRYGKLIVKLENTDNGWDGNFNGKSMPADDYWFRVKLENDQEFNGHFSLVR